MNDEAASHVDLLHARVRALLAETDSEEAIIEALSREGVEPHYARMLIENIHEEQRRRVRFINQLIAGISITGIGLLINMVSYQAASANGSSSFWIFWGIVAVGISTIIRAFVLRR